MNDTQKRQVDRGAPIVQGMAVVLVVTSVAGAVSIPIQDRQAERRQNAEGGTDSAVKANA